MGKKDIRLLAKLFMEFFSAAARSDPEMIYCKKRGGGWGRAGARREKQQRERGGQRRRSLFNIENWL